MTRVTTGTDEAENRAKARVGITVDGKWRLDSLLGVGGMAAVYAGTHRNGTRGAIKILNPEIALSANAKTRFLREGYVANKIGHPGVVLILDDDEAPDGTAYLVMELLDGDTLQSSIEAGQLMPVTEVLRIARDVLEVLEVAHAKEIIHRDLKPGNLLVTRVDRSVKLLDFGVAKLRESTVEGIPNVTTLSAIGTPGFMPPEQARGRLDNVDGRADIWALGATMFALLTCQYVHDEETPNEQLLAAMTRPARPLREVLPDVPEAVAAIVDRALAFDREERYRDAHEMKEAIAKALTGLANNVDADRRAVVSSPPNEGAPTTTSVDPMRARGTPNTAAREAIANAATLMAPSTDGAAVSDVDARRRSSSKPPSPSSNRSWLGLAAAGVVVVGIIAVVSFNSSGAKDEKTSASATPTPTPTPTPIPTPSLSPAAVGTPSPTPDLAVTEAVPSMTASTTIPTVAAGPATTTNTGATRISPPPMVRSSAPPSHPSIAASASAAPAASVDIFGRRH